MVSQSAAFTMPDASRTAASTMGLHQPTYSVSSTTGSIAAGPTIGFQQDHRYPAASTVGPTHVAAPGDTSETASIHDTTIQHLLDMIRPQFRISARFQYPRDFKLGAISYWRQQSNNGLRKSDVASQLRIHPQLLQNWISKEGEILSMRKEQLRAAKVKAYDIPEMEEHLCSQYRRRYAHGLDVGQAWFIAEGKRWYEEHYPERVVADPMTRHKTYTGFNFSGRWFLRFKKRNKIPSDAALSPQTNWVQEEAPPNIPDQQQFSDDGRL